MVPFPYPVVSELRDVGTCAWSRLHTATKGDAHALTIFVILLVLWLVGLVTSHTVGGFIHLLLVIAVSSS